MTKVAKKVAQTVAKKASKAKADPAASAAAVEPAFAPIVAAFANDPAVSRRRMFSSESVLSVGGKIFVMMVRGKLVLKLPEARVDELVAKGKGTHFDPGHGRLMKEWLSLTGSKPPWLELSREAYQFVKGASR
jgi:TfoX/Sxy family transcriptional regulator of competence genes